MYIQKNPFVTMDNRIERIAVPVSISEEPA